MLKQILFSRSIRFICCVLCLYCLCPVFFAFADQAESKPWEVTRKADNRVLPMQNGVGDEYFTQPEVKQPATKASEEQNVKQEAKPKTTPKVKLAAPPKKTPQKKVAPAKKIVKKPVAPKKVAQKTAPAPTPPSHVVGTAGKPQVAVLGDAVIVVVPTSVPVEDTRYLNLNKPRRVAFDLMGKWKYTDNFVLRINKGPLEKVVVGKHKNYLRVVLHMTKQAIPAQVIPQFQIMEKGIKVMFLL